MFLFFQGERDTRIPRVKNVQFVLISFVPSSDNRESNKFMRHSPKRVYFQSGKFVWIIRHKIV